jgi:phosphohistidine phosphatase
MKTLYLVRHAKSSWDDPALPDLERPLNKRGWRDAPKMGEKLVNKGVSADAIWCSPALRSKETARFLASALRFPLSDIKEESALYFSVLDDLLRDIQSCPDTVSSLMIVGHNPTITEISNMLTKQGVETIESLPTCGIVALEFVTTSWIKLRKNTGKRVFFDYPKNS